MRRLFSLTTLLVFGGAAIAQENFTIKDCIQYGLSNHRSIKVYQNQKDQADQKAKEALSTYLPQVNVSGEIDANLKLMTQVLPGEMMGQPGKLIPVQFGTRYSNTATAQLDQKVYDQSALLGIKAGKPNQELAILNEQQNKENIIYSIASAYYQVIVAQKQLQLLRDNKGRFEKILQVTELQSQQGVAKKVDVKKVQVNLTNVESQIKVVESNYALAYNTLKNYMGMSQETVVQLTDTSRWLTTTNSEQKLSETFNYSNTTEYQLQQKQLDLYDINRRMIKAGYMPTVSVFARYGFNAYDNDFLKAYENLYSNAVVGLKLSIPIFDGFRKSAQYKQANIEVANMQENLKINEDMRDLQFKNAQTVLKKSSESIITNNENMRLAQEVYDNSTLQYKQGVASLTDLLNAETSYRDAQTNYIQSLLDYYVAQLNIEKANGTLLNYYSQL